MKRKAKSILVTRSTKVLEHAGTTAREVTRPITYGDLGDQGPQVAHVGDRVSSSKVTAQLDDPRKSMADQARKVKKS